VTWALVLLASPTRADRQTIAPGIGAQDAVVIHSGANGICQTAAQRDDVQVIPVGQGEPFADAIRCGPDRTVSTQAAGDDRQLMAVGDTCNGANAVVIDTGPNGVTDTAATGDDVQAIAVGSGHEETGCIVTGPNGLADTGDPVAPDDVRLIAVGTAAPNAPVVRCGRNQVAETFANNVRAGDDVQRIGVGDGCTTANAVVVDAGANGISETRAQGTELVLLGARPQRLAIRRRQESVSRRVKLVVANLEFGAGAPPARAYSLVTDDGSCPNGTVVEVDADAHAPGVQATAAVPIRGKVRASVVLTFHVADVTSVAHNLPFRCAVEVTAVATDTAPDPDDAGDPANNSARVEVEILDQNDL
jgi:hypothetical protein